MMEQKGAEMEILDDNKVADPWTISTTSLQLAGRPLRFTTHIVIWNRVAQHVYYKKPASCTFAIIFVFYTGHQRCATVVCVRRPINHANPPYEISSTYRIENAKAKET